MIQKEIRDYNGQLYTKEEGAEIITELNDRTKYDDPEYNSMQSLGEKMKVVEEEVTAAVSGYRGPIAISDTPTEPGIYQPIESGTYINAGGLVVDLSDGLITLGFDGTDWGMQVVPVDLAKLDELENEFVNTYQKGSHFENFKDNTDIIATNLTDGATPVYTTTFTDDFLTIYLTTGARYIAFSTHIKIKPVKTKIVLTQEINSVTSSCGVGFAIGNGAYVLNQAGFIQKRKDGVTSLLASGVSPLTVGTLIYTIYFDGEGSFFAKVSMNGSEASFSDTIDSEDFSLAQISIVSVSHSLTQEVVGIYLNEFITEVISENELSPINVSDLNAAGAMLEILQSNIPNGLTFPLSAGMKLYAMEARKYFSNINLVSILSENDKTVLQKYVDPIAGNDTNSGTISEPYKSIKKAIQSGGTGKLSIKAKPGLYDKDTAWGGVVFAGTHLQVEPWGDGDVISSNHHAGLVWTLSSGTMYTATIINVSTVFDSTNLNVDGDYIGLDLVASSALCASTPNSYYVTGTTIYVNTFDGRLPDDSLRVYENKVNAYIQKNQQIVFCKNIHFEGGQFPCYATLSAVDQNMTVYMKSCSFNYGSSDGLRVFGNLLVISQKCIATSNMRDGFGYSKYGAFLPPQLIEIDCEARYNGRSPTGINNGSSVHDLGTLIIRVNGNYHHNLDRNIHDIGGSMSWNLGCKSHNSISGKSNFCSGASTDATLTKMWLDGCDSFDSTFDLEALAGKGIIYTKDLVTDGNNVVGSDIESY